MRPPVAIKFTIWPYVENVCPSLVQTIVIYLAIAPNKAHYCTCCAAIWALERFFTGEAVVEYF